MSKFQAEVEESSLNLVDVCSHVLFLTTHALSDLFLSPGPETFTLLALHSLLHMSTLSHNILN